MESGSVRLEKKPKRRKSVEVEVDQVLSCCGRAMGTRDRFGCLEPRTHILFLDPRFGGHAAKPQW